MRAHRRRAGCGGQVSGGSDISGGRYRASGVDFVRHFRTRVRLARCICGSRNRQARRSAAPVREHRWPCAGEPGFSCHDDRVLEAAGNRQPDCECWCALCFRPHALRHGDFWELPFQGGGNAGDCEDYVLQKRQMLLAHGIPMTALSIALVRASWGEEHAVLLVHSSQGDYVLDNLTPWIKPWSEVSYSWIKWQSANNPEIWVRPPVR